MFFFTPLKKTRLQGHLRAYSAISVAIAANIGPGKVASLRATARIVNMAGHMAGHMLDHMAGHIAGHMAGHNMAGHIWPAIWPAIWPPSATWPTLQST